MPCSGGADTFAGVIPLDEARQIVLDACRRRPPITVPLSEANRLVLADEVVSAETVPPFSNSAVDGYAVIAEDLASVPVELEVIGEVAAGAVGDMVVGRGQAVRIMTGAPIPDGADAVVMVEDTERLGADRVRIGASVPPGAAVRHAGEDVQPGDLLFEAGTEIRPAVVGVLAGVNAREVPVYPRLRVAVLSTGDELVTDGSELLPGQIRESNLSMLVSLVAEAGCLVTDLGVVPDDEDRVAEVLTAAVVDHDAIVTSGGVSMGDYDVIKAVLNRIAQMRWMQIAIKPAKPFAFGLLEGVPVFGLPGNPVSSLVSFEMIARPALRQMMGHHDLGRRQVTGVLAEPVVRRPDGKEHLIRVITDFAADGTCSVRPVKAQGSHQLAQTALADAIAVVPDGDGLAAGSELVVHLLID